MGFDATPKIIDGGVYFQTIGNAKTKAQTGFANWFQDFPHPQNFMFLVDGKSIQPTNNQNYGNVDDPEDHQAGSPSSTRSRVDRRGRRATGRTLNDDAGRARLDRPVRPPQAGDVPLGADGLRQLLDLPPGLLQRLLELLPQVAGDAARGEGASGALPRVGLVSVGGKRDEPWRPSPQPSAVRGAGRVRGGGSSASTCTASGPWRLGLRRLRRNKVALLLRRRLRPARASPAWPRRSGPTTSRTPARTRTTSPTRSRSTARRSTSSALDGVPIGPTWQGEFFLGADRNGRDIMVRLLYGGRNSLLIGIAAALITTLLSVVLGLLAGYFRGWTDAAIRGAARHHLGVPGDHPRRRARRGARAGRPQARADHDRGRLARDPDLRDRGRLRAVHGAADPRPGAVAAREGVRRGGARPGRRAAADHVHARSCRTSTSTILVFFPLLVANAILLEAALSFLGAGVQPPEPVLGHDDRRGRRADRHRAAPGDRARA